MGGKSTTAVLIALTHGLVFALTGYGQSSASNDLVEPAAQVISMQQPEGIKQDCACSNCGLGVACDGSMVTAAAFHPPVKLAHPEVVTLANEIIVEPAVRCGYGTGAVPPCGPSCSRCGGAGTCRGLYTSPVTFTWMDCQETAAASCDSGSCDSASCDDSADCDSMTCDADGSCDADSCDADGSCDACEPTMETLACDASACVAEASCDIDWSCLDLCCRQGFWLRADALVWWSNDDDIPALATSSPLGTPIGTAGVLGLSTTNTLFDDPLYGEMRPGGRLRFGWWADDCRHGLDGSVWGLRNDQDENIWSSDGDPAYARPFYNVDPLVDAQDAELVSFDSVLSGSLQINTSSDVFGGDIGIRKLLCCCSDFCGNASARIDAVVGYSFFRVREGVRVTENLESIALTGPTVLGTTIDLFDDFQTRNEFHGANFGLAFMHQRGRWTTDLTPRIALGNLAREVSIDGGTTVTVPGVAPSSRVGGLLAQTTNIGVYKDDEFVVLPEVQFNLGYQLSCRTKLTVGFDFKYLGDVVRPGDVIDPTVNGLLLDPGLPVAGPARPRFDWNDSEMWLMGLSLGIACNF